MKKHKIELAYAKPAYWVCILCFKQWEELPDLAQMTDENKDCIERSSSTNEFERRCCQMEFDTLPLVTNGRQGGIRRERGE